MFKQWGDVYGYLPGVTFNSHTGPAAQMATLDDFDSAEGFDSVAHGFVGRRQPQRREPAVAAPDRPRSAAVRGARLGRGYQEHCGAGSRSRPSASSPTRWRTDRLPGPRSAVPRPQRARAAGAAGDHGHGPNEHRLQTSWRTVRRLLGRWAQCRPGTDRGCAGSSAATTSAARGWATTRTRRWWTATSRCTTPGPVRVQRGRLPDLRRGQPAPDPDGDHRSREQAADRAARWLRADPRGGGAGVTAVLTPQPTTRRSTTICRTWLRWVTESAPHG